MVYLLIRNYIWYSLTKKPLISFFLLCVFSITFIHSIIPHHHEDEWLCGPEAFYFSSAANNSSPFETAFYYYQHDPCCTVVSQAGCPGCSFCAANYDKGGFMQSQLNRLLQPVHVNHVAINNTSVPSFLYSAKKLLRGPPAIS